MHTKPELNGLAWLVPFKTWSTIFMKIDSFFLIFLLHVILSTPKNVVVYRINV